MARRVNGERVAPSGGVVDVTAALVADGMSLASAYRQARSEAGTEAAPSESAPLYEWQKNKREVVRASVDEYKGHPLANLRVFYKDDEGVYRPSSKGIAINVEQLAELEAAVKAMRAAVDAAGAVR